MPSIFIIIDKVDLLSLSLISLYDGHLRRRWHRWKRKGRNLWLLLYIVFIWCLCLFVVVIVAGPPSTPRLALYRLLKILLLVLSGSSTYLLLDPYETQKRKRKREEENWTVTIIQEHHSTRFLLSFPCLGRPEIFGFFINNRPISASSII